MNIENKISNFCVGVWVGGQHRANVSYRFNDAEKNSTSLGPNPMTVGVQWVKPTNEKSTKTENYGGQNCVG